MLCYVYVIRSDKRRFHPRPFQLPPPPPIPAVRVKQTQHNENMNSMLFPSSATVSDIRDIRAFLFRHKGSGRCLRRLARALRLDGDPASLWTSLRLLRLSLRSLYTTAFRDNDDEEQEDEQTSSSSSSSMTSASTSTSSFVAVDIVVRALLRRLDDIRSVHSCAHAAEMADFLHGELEQLQVFYRRRRVLNSFFVDSNAKR